MPYRLSAQIRTSVGICTLSAVGLLLSATAVSSTSPPSVLDTLRRVADWQLAHPTGSSYDSGEQGWIYCALYAGILALDEIDGTGKYRHAMIAMGTKFRWRAAPRLYHADDQCISQIYLDLYAKHPDPVRLAPTRESFDLVLTHPARGGLRTGNISNQERWSWCDALFMAPPAWIRLYRVTNDPRYLEFMDREWWATTDYLYDSGEHLFFRDGSYFDKREANGAKVFWSRGNGWVLAGLARILPLLPADHPHRARYQRQFEEMAARVGSLQQPDGLWRASLLDPASFPLKETSGSSFFTFALAWGINAGLLDRRIYEPTVRKAWAALLGCVTPDGKVQNVQPVGEDPHVFEPTHNEPFGAGAFLLAGAEVYRLER